MDTVLIHPSRPRSHPADTAPEPPERFDPHLYPILARHWPDLPPGADTHVAHLPEREHQLEHGPEVRAA